MIKVCVIQIYTHFYRKWGIRLSVSINDYIKYFEESVKAREKDSLGHGNTPRYPMVMFYFGQDAEQVAKWVFENLLIVWPQYERDLLSFCIPEKSDDKYHCVSPTGETNTVDFKTIQTMVSKLFGERSHFHELYGLQVYFCLDTSSVKSANEIYQWLTLSKDILAKFTLQKMAYFTLFLNEDLSHKEHGITNQILNGFEEYPIEDINNLFILSNQLDNGVIQDNMSNCCRLYSNLIMLTNDSNAGISLKKGIYTVGYSNLAKPLEDIAKVVVDMVVDKCKDLKKEKTPSNIFNDELPERLGILKNGIPQLLDSYIRSSVVFPTEEQLSLFPRKNDTDIISANITAEQLDNVTMGAWSGYLSLIEKKVENDLKVDSQFKRVWYNEYKNVIISHFSSDEILILASNTDQLEQLFSRMQKPSKNQSALSYARVQIGYAMCSNPIIIKLFIDVIKDLGKEAENMGILWNNLLNSRRVVFDVNDNNIREFYQRKVTNYFDHHSEEKKQLFEGIHSEQDLANYFRAILDDIISSDSIYTMPFYQELEARLKHSDNPIEAKIYIRNKLIQNIAAYLNTTGSLDDPVASTILLKTQTTLHESLKADFPDYYFYNTGDDDKAESMLIYRLDIVKHLLR